MKSRLLLLWAIALTLGTAGLAQSPAADAATHPHKLFAPAVHRGDRGRDVAAAQYILTGQKPAKYPDIHPFRGHKVTGQFGKFTAKAVLRARWLLGEPVQYRKSCHCRPGKRAVFDRDLYLILTGKKARPIGWIGKRGKRIALARRVKTSSAHNSPCSLRIVSLAQSQIGVHEIPDGSNRGPRISYPVGGVPSYQSSTGAYGAAWCDSFDMWDLMLNHAWPLTRFAGVFLTVDQARQHYWLRSTPAAGALVAYVCYAGRIRICGGHIGIVERVTHDGFVTIEGNSHNQVMRHFRRFGDATVFIYPPCLIAWLARH